MEDNQADGEFGAENFMLNNEALWSTWVDDAAKEKLLAALKAL